jgi:homogentisate phytyltransferase / homogentisate geranylgeranyltransferase
MGATVRRSLPLGTILIWSAGALWTAQGFQTQHHRPCIHYHNRQSKLRPSRPLPFATLIFSLKDHHENVLAAQSRTNSHNSTTVLPAVSSARNDVYATDSADVDTTTNVTSHLESDKALSETVLLASADSSPRPSFPVILWRFTRPHTLIGSALAIPALHLLAAPTWASIWTTRHALSILYALVPSLLMNLYVTGLNQITDVEIDKINKPNLPMAAGLLSRRDATITVLTALLVSLTLGRAHPLYGTPGLNTVLWGSGLLGTLYSLPPIRLKRFPLLAALCIVAVRGTIINASFFAHAQAAAGFGSSLSASVWHCLRHDGRCFWSSLFFGCFGIVIALMKDVPDVLGDRVGNVRTFSVRVGPQRIFHASRYLLTSLFGACAVSFGVGAAQAATVSTSWWRAASRLVVMGAAAWAARSVHCQATQIDPESPSMVYQYYMHLWKLFYLCYLVLPLAR